MSLPVRSPPFRFAAALVVCLILVYYLFSTPESSHHHLDVIYSSADEFYDRVVHGNKAAFVEDALETEIDGPFNHTAIRELCARTQWTEGLIFQCKPPQGGVGKVRNIILNCVRYAIEAGASFIIPKITAKGLDPIDPQREKEVDLSYLFDAEYFTSSLADACPQMHIYSSLNDLWDFPSVANTIDLAPQDLSKTFVHETVIKSPKEWSASFYTWVNGSTSNPITSEMPARVVLHDPLLQFPLTYDSPAFTASFGRILKFREEVRVLAAMVLFALDQKYKLGLDPDNGIEAGKFYGAHLRTGADVEETGGTSYEIQSQNYLLEALHQNLTLIYLTSGSPADTTKFISTGLSPKYNITTETKDTLLAAPGFEAERAELDKLTWNQQSLVDFQVLLWSSWFGGTKESSFAWNVALRRHVVVGRGLWVDVAKTKATQSFRDALSTIFGGVGDYGFMGASLWP